jgi:hypothetical protein
MPVRDGLFRDILHHPVADVVIELVHFRGVVRHLPPRSAFEDNDGKRGRAVISSAIKRPVQPPPAITTSTGLTVRIPRMPQYYPNNRSAASYLHDTGYGIIIICRHPTKP